MILFLVHGNSGMNSYVISKDAISPNMARLYQAKQYLRYLLREVQKMENRIEVEAEDLVSWAPVNQKGSSMRYATKFRNEMYQHYVQPLILQAREVERTVKQLSELVQPDVRADLTQLSADVLQGVPVSSVHFE